MQRRKEGIIILAKGSPFIMSGLRTYFCWYLWELALSECGDRCKIKQGPGSNGKFFQVNIQVICTSYRLSSYALVTIIFKLTLLSTYYISVTLLIALYISLSPHRAQYNGILHGGLLRHTRLNNLLEVAQLEGDKAGIQPQAI